MAAGDFTLFDQYLLDHVEKIHDKDDTIKLALVTSAVTPTAADAAPHFGGTGTTNYATNEVTPGGNYAAGGPAMAGVASSITSNVFKLDFTDLAISQNASNPTNARWGILYNDTDANKRCIGFLDLGSDRDLSGGDFTYNLPANGLYRVGPGTIT